MGLDSKKLRVAQCRKRDEFYTLYDNIEDEVAHYKRHFKGKCVYCNCNDSADSCFYQYFKNNFHELGLRELICTSYVQSDMFDPAVGQYVDWKGEGEPVWKPMWDNGDFRGGSSSFLSIRADIFCTNPPFSLFRVFADAVIKSEKQFLVLGNINAVSYRRFFRYLREKKVWVGCSKLGASFRTPIEYGAEKLWVSTACWFTNMVPDVEKEPFNLTAMYSPDRYPRYDNYDAIEVSKLVDIPKDYYGVMGVPVTFMYKHRWDQFNIVDVSERHNRWFPKTKVYTQDDCDDWNHKNSGACLRVDGKLNCLYKRIFIQRADAPEVN